ncbi:MAG: hydrogenase formation protein HypD [Desulfobulbaceae bacterium]|nr:hydrogenase formation protein HypD [Desulfobulbaceae bacterium]
MKYVEEYRNNDLVAELATELHRLVDRPIRIMEVCGTHTVSIFSHGLRALFPKNLELISGPGCPVCVTPINHINDFQTIAGLNGVSIAVFGDLIRVPGTTDSLSSMSAKGRDIRVVYSPADVLHLAKQHPQRVWMLPAVGFETTAPAIAAVVLEASRLNINNFTIYPANKTVPAALDALFGNNTIKLDGLLCPGHVSTIIGLEPYRSLAHKHGIACAVAGFEPTDIFHALISLATMIHKRETKVQNCYTRAVTDSGNERARQLIEEVFTPEDSRWRGFGVIPGSGLMLKDKFAHFNALHRFTFTQNKDQDPASCRCGEVLKGVLQPRQCPIFGKSCTPSSPIGPCMVSSEGTCAAHYRYGSVEINL